MLGFKLNHVSKSGPCYNHTVELCINLYFTEIWWNRKRYLTYDLPGVHYIISVNQGNQMCLVSTSIRHLIVRSHKFSKARGCVLKWLHPSESDGRFGNNASGRWDNFKHKYRVFETLRDLPLIRPLTYSYGQAICGQQYPDISSCYSSEQCYYPPEHNFLSSIEISWNIKIWNHLL